MGIGSLSLYDPKACSYADMAANWAIREADVVAKHGRVEASLPRIAELNGYVAVSAHTATLSAETLAKYNVSPNFYMNFVAISVLISCKGQYTFD